MIFTIPQNLFSSVLSKSQSILERKSTRPILENILIEAYDGYLRISATDLRVSLKQQVPCIIKKQGSISIPGRKLNEIIRQMPKDDINVELRENGWLTLSADKSIFHLPGIVAEEYPSLPASPASFLDVKSDIFRSMLDKTLFAASSDESRIYLCGVFIKSISLSDTIKQLRMVATDGHRLSLSEQTIDADLSIFSDGFILPKKGLSELRSMLDSVDDKFKLAYSDGRLFVEVDNITLSITIIDGNFPNYEQVVPQEVATKISISRHKLADALKRVSLLSDQETHTIIMEVVSTNTVISSKDSQFGDAREELDSEYDGPPIRVAFNSVYLLEAIRTLEGDFVSFSIGDSLAPCLLRGSEDPNHLCVVMPMRID